VRKILSLLLLALFALPLASTLLASSQGEANLPACCRRAGAHHCAGMSAPETAAASTDHAHVAILTAHCPSYPATVATLHPPFFPFGADTSIPANNQSQSAKRISPSSRQTTAHNPARPTRGPPTLL
jgi:hypothetical protein